MRADFAAKPIPSRENEHCRKALVGAFLQGLMDRSDPKGRARGAQANPAPNPWQALGLPGRSGHPRAARASPPTGRPILKTVAGPSFGRQGRCASPERRSAHRHPASIAHSGTVVTGSAGAPGRSPAGTPSLFVPSRSRPPTGGGPPSLHSPWGHRGIPTGETTYDHRTHRVIHAHSAVPPSPCPMATYAV